MFSFLSFKLTKPYHSKMLVDNCVFHIWFQKWDDIEIEEETESGSKVRSTIRVPMQPSWYVQSVLYSLCQEVNRVGGHALRR